jgi:Uma2 family endonuclease
MLTPRALPILESGDRLTREEFHRRYCLRPDLKKAELVEGRVYVGGRVTARHGQAHAEIVGWLGTYGVSHPDTRVANSGTVILDTMNEVQPDAFMWREEGGAARLDANGYIEGAPQLVAEVAASSASYDLHDKKEAYQRNGVREYVVWRVLDQAVDWFRLHEGQYVKVEPDEQGLIESATFPGLRLDVPKLLAGDLAGVLAAIR